MKKHLIAAAVAAAVAVPAAAQVTIGGNFDVGYDMSDRNTGDTFTAEGILSTPALTLSGSEDLGGGLKAFFNVNSRLGHVMEIDGNAGSNVAAEDKIGQRQGTINFGDRGAQIGISGGFGSLAIGKTTATAMGSMRGGLVGNLSLNDESTWGDRPNNTVSYTSPAFNGLSVRYINQLSTGSSEISATYSNGPISVSVAANDVKAVAANANQVNTAVVAGKDKAARASYNFGFATANITYMNIETVTSGVERKQHSIGVAIPVPQVKGLTLSLENGNRETASLADNKVTNFSLVYNLSKRTNVYYAYQTLDSQAKDLSAFGIRHSF